MSLKTNSWLVAVAFGLALSPSSGETQEQTVPQQPQADAEQTTSQQLPIPFPVFIVEDQNTASARERAEAEERRREAEDLTAQQGMNEATQAMNEATQRMAKYALWSTVLVAIGTVLLLVTLWLTLAANRAAQRVASTTREVGTRQLRAYVALSSSEIIDRGERGLWVLIQFKNYGQTPAREVRFGRVHYHGDPVPTSEGHANIDSYFVYPDMAPQQVQSFFYELPFELVVDSSASIANGENKIYRVAGKIIYFDVFKEEHTLHFSVRTPEGSAIEPMVFAMDEDGNFSD